MLQPQLIFAFTNLTLVQKGVFYSASKIYNHLPLNIKMLSKDAKQFKSKLRSCLIEHTFYNLDEYYQLTFLISFIYLMYQYKLVSYIMTSALHTFLYVLCIFM